MAERRMFAKSVTNSARFLMMPISSRLLYYDLGMAADDDGIVEAFTVMRMSGATEDDLRVLNAKGFITILTEEFVSYINDWRTNNSVRGDRYKPSVYQNLLVQLNILNTNGLPDDAQLYTNGLPDDAQLYTNGKPRLGKDRLGKDSIGKDKENIVITENIGGVGDESDTADSLALKKKKDPERHKHGEYGNVLLSDEEYKKLQEEFPEDYGERIERLSGYIASTGKKYKSHLATIRNWARKDAERQNTAGQTADGWDVIYAIADGRGKQ